MPRLKLHLDADASRKGLVEVLQARGYDVTRTPNDDLPADASDEYQLLWATAQGRVIFTHNLKDFLSLSGRFPNHHGILLAAQSKYSLTQLITSLERVMDEASAEDFIGQVRWLSDWK
jgi:hypothetical protein